MNADLGIYLYFVLFLILLILFVASKIEKRRSVSRRPGKNRLDETESAGSGKDEEMEHR